MRPQARILFAFLSLCLATSVTADGQTLLPFIVDASGNLQQLESNADVAEQPDATPAAEKDQKPEASEEKQAPRVDKPAVTPLTPEMAAFRDQVRRTLSQVYSRSLNAQSSLPVEVMAFCEAFGHTAEIASGSRSGQKLNAVGAMCWNFPCGGYKLLRTDGKKVVARVGYGYQQRPAQLLAVLALDRVPATYEIRIDDFQGTVADLVAAEKLACRKGLDQSGTLIGLAFYAKPKETWKNGLGETWSLPQLLEEELNRKADPSRVDVIHRLMGISYAVKRLDPEEASAKEVVERAKKHIEEFYDFALNLQNDDGSWHPGFLAYRGTSKDTDGVLYSTGAILSWLIYSLPEERLEDQRIVRGLGFLNKQLAYRYGRRSGTAPSPRDLIGRMNAVRALSLYDIRYFTPHTPQQPDETEKPGETSMKRKSLAYPSIATRPPLDQYHFTNPYAGS